MVKTVLKSGLVGAVLAAIAAIIMFGGRGQEGTQRGQLLMLMLPTFALIGAILGALNGFLFSIIRGFKR
jgi:ABC-type xylose transport system permease subunit